MAQDSAPAVGVSYEKRFVLSWNIIHERRDVMYKKVVTDMNFVEREKEVEKFWKDNDIFEKSMKEREGSPMYTFYDGPPTANGKPHIGHVLTRVIK